MKIAIAFCVYGTQPKYLKGLTQNLRLIRDLVAPELGHHNLHTYIFVGNDVPDSYVETYRGFANTHIIHVAYKGPALMFERIRAIASDDNVNDICFSRDIDSRIGARDIWAMKQFIESGAETGFHIIRDHHYHRMRIMGGTFGVKRDCFVSDDLNISTEIDRYISQKGGVECIGYGADEDFLQLSLIHI